MGSSRAMPYTICRTSGKRSRSSAWPRMLSPGGVLRVRDLIYDFQPSAVEENVERWLDGAASDSARGYTREDFARHIRTEHSTFRWLFEPMLEAASFEIVSTDFRGSVYGAYTCLKR